MAKLKLGPIVDDKPINCRILDLLMKKWEFESAVLSDHTAVVPHLQEQSRNGIQYDVAIIDAGRSERYGCEATDFVDEHHALPACYARVFARFWPATGAISNTTHGDKTIKLPAGLHAPN